MMRFGKKQIKTRLLGAVVIAAAAMAASQPAFSQSGAACPSNGLPPTTTTLCNDGPIDPATWVFGPQNNLTAAQQIAQYWNPVMARIKVGLPFMGKRVATPGTLGGPTAPGGYCSVAQYDQTNNHFTWVDFRDTGLDVSQVWPMWLNTACPANTACPGSTCPALNFTTTAARGMLASSIDERENQHGADGGAVIFIIEVSSVADALEANFWTYWPPYGHHSQGSNQLGSVYTGNTLSPPPYPGQLGISLNTAGASRNTFNRNNVMIAQIASVEGAQAAAGIAAVDGIHALFLDEVNLASTSAGVANYDTLANGVRAAAQAAAKYLCTADRSVTPNTMTCLPPTP